MMRLGWKLKHSQSDWMERKLRPQTLRGMKAASRQGDKHLGRLVTCGILTLEAAHANMRVATTMEDFSKVAWPCLVVFMAYLERNLGQFLPSLLREGNSSRGQL